MPSLDLELEHSPFDPMAENYDEAFTRSPVGQAQRAAVWRELEKAFHPGDQVLDVGCGTGVDACFLAERGVSVLGLDSSREMVRVAGERVRECSSRFRNASVELHTWSADCIAAIQPHREFDGAFSNFGVVNCLDDLRAFALALAGRLRPNAKVLLCFMGPCCLWETAWFVAHGSASRATRRWSRAGSTVKFSGSAEFRVRYPRIEFLASTFGPEFRLRGIKGIGICVPPSYAGVMASRFPRLMKLAISTDRLVAGWPGIRVLADHILIIFERTEL